MMILLYLIGFTIGLAIGYGLLFLAYLIYTGTKNAHNQNQNNQSHKQNQNK